MGILFFQFFQALQYRGEHAKARPEPQTGSSMRYGFNFLFCSRVHILSVLDTLKVRSYLNFTWRVGGLSK